MNSGDLRYTVTDKTGQSQVAEIPAEVLRKGRRKGQSNKDTILIYLAEQGFAVDAPKVEQKKKTARPRKADKQKQSIINVLVDAMQQQGNIKINVINDERQFQFEVDNELYEVTLVKKRKPKN